MFDGFFNPAKLRNGVENLKIASEMEYLHPRNLTWALKKHKFISLLMLVLEFLFSPEKNHHQVCHFWVCTIQEHHVRVDEGEEVVSDGLG